ncbi:MAG: S-layer homology domain-containing protein, partial [Oscillospiraceae bacterium]|nr:S-layer homology domain-containing protein [Oscillospiraceae bacterium]
MKKRILSLIVSLAMILTLGIPSIALSPADYTDLPDSSHFTYNGIVSAIENGIMQGVGGGVFAPNSVITRAEAAIYLVNVMGATVKASLAGATDVKPDAWYVKDGRLAVAVQMGVISPVGGKLRPDDLVTREEAFDMMAKAVKLSSKTWSLTRFEDRTEVSNTYAGSIQALVNNGYVNGIPSNGGFILSPKGTMTRGEFATLFGNVFQGFVSGAVSSVKSGNVVVKKAGTVL